MKRSTLTFVLLFLLGLSAYAQVDGESPGVQQTGQLTPTSSGFIGRIGEQNRTLTVLPPAGSSADYIYTWQHNDASLPPGTFADGQVLTFDALTFEHAGEYTCTAVSLADPDHPVTSTPMTVSVIEELPVTNRLPAFVMITMFVLVVFAARHFRSEGN